jgi:rhamnosyl/mannosyltransferase
MQKFLGSADHIIATSPNYLETSKVLQNYINKVSVIPIGLDLLTYRKPCARTTAHYRDLFGNRFFLFIGAFRYYKGLKHLIKASSEVPYPIVIVGAGLIESQIRAEVTRKQLKNIFFIGQVSEENKSSLLEACYAVIFPSNLRAEAFGVTLLEGAMFGKPLISCEIGTGTTYINLNQETGLVIPPSDPSAIASAMTWLWNRPEEAKAMGLKAKERYLALFTGYKMAQSYFEIYHKILNR